MISRESPQPLVTAAVICYNHAKFVVEALESVKAQAYPNLHLVVLDDCSTDGSVEIIRNWLNCHSPNSVFVAHTTNMGICRTNNDALAHAKGKYIRFLAADDRWMPNMLTRQIEIMEAASEDVGVLYSDAFQMNEAGELLPRMFIETCRSFTQMPEGWIFDTLLEGNFLLDAVVRRRCFKVVGGADESLVFEDWDLWLRISRQFKFKYFPEPTAYYRVVQTSMTRTLQSEMIDSERRIIVKCLRRGWLTGKKKEEAVHKEYCDACQAYQEKLPGRVREVAWIFRRRLCITRALMLLFVSLGVPYRRFEQVIEILVSLRERTKVLLFHRRESRE